jgi:hypothetical protein
MAQLEKKNNTLLEFHHLAAEVAEAKSPLSTKYYVTLRAKNNI